MPAFVGILLAQLCLAQVQKNRYVIYLNADGRDCAESMEKEPFYIYNNELPCTSISSTQTTPNCCAFPAGTVQGDKSLEINGHTFMPEADKFQLMVKCGELSNFQMMFDFSAEAENLHKPTIRLRKRNDSLLMIIQEFHPEMNTPIQEFTFSLNTISEVCHMEIPHIQSFFSREQIIRIPVATLKLHNPIVEDGILRFQWFGAEAIQNVESAKIYNSQGETVGELPLNSLDLGVNVQSVNVSAFKPGTYFIQVLAGVTSSSHKFVVQQ